jgi:hypothetical protein
MNESVEIPASEAAAFEAFVDQCLAEMAEANARMEKDQSEIEQLKAETRAIMDSIKAVLYAEKAI